MCPAGPGGTAGRELEDLTHRLNTVSLRRPGGDAEGAVGRFGGFGGFGVGGGGASSGKREDKLETPASSARCGGARVGVRGRREIPKADCMC